MKTQIVSPSRLLSFQMNNCPWWRFFCRSVKFVFCAIKIFLNWRWFYLDCTNVTKSHLMICSSFFLSFSISLYSFDKWMGISLNAKYSREWNWCTSTHQTNEHNRYFPFDSFDKVRKIENHIRGPVNVIRNAEIRRDSIWARENERERRIMSIIR